MPAPLSTQASAQYAALVAASGLTAQVRALSPDIIEACKVSSPMNWTDDLAGISVGIPAKGETRDAFAKSLGAAFGSVATQASGVKHGARVRFIEVDVKGDDGKTSTVVETSVTFRKVNPRASK